MTVTTNPFLVYDHRLGLHDGQQVVGCPSCFPDEAAVFTAATDAQPSESYGGLFTFTGLNIPVSPRIGDTWHEPGAGVWVWVQRRDPGSSVRSRPPETWVNAYDVTRTRSPHLAVPAPEEVRLAVHPDVMRIGKTITLSGELLASKAMGVDVEREAEAQTRAACEAHMEENNLIPVSIYQHTWGIGPTSSSGGKTCNTEVLARPRPQFVASVD